MDEKDIIKMYEPDPNNWESVEKAFYHALRRLKFDIETLMIRQIDQSFVSGGLVNKLAELHSSIEDYLNG